MDWGIKYCNMHIANFEIADKHIEVSYQIQEVQHAIIKYGHDLTQFDPVAIHRQRQLK